MLRTISRLRKGVPAITELAKVKLVTVALITVPAIIVGVVVLVHRDGSDAITIL